MRARGFTEGFTEGFAKGVAEGFTLIEVIVALAVIGLVLPPLLLNAAERVRGLRVQEERMVANAVAQNRLALTRLGALWVGDRPERVEEGEEFMAGRTWYWRLETVPTEVDGYYRLVVDVSADRQNKTALVNAQAYFDAR